MSPPLDPATLVEAYLLLDQPRQRLGHWCHALAALDSPNAPPLALVAAYYDSAADQAVLSLKYDVLALGAERLGFVVEVALLAEIGMVQPAELSPGDRARLLTDRLARCTLESSGQRTAVAALMELVRQIKARQIRAAVAGATLRDPPAPPATPLRARATRDAVSAPAVPTVAPAGQDAPPIPRSTRDDLEKRRAPAAPVARHTVPRAPSPSALGPAPAGAARAGSPAPEAEPYAPTGPQAGTEMIQARYLRSGRWLPIRVGALSLRGAALLAGALPRTQDVVDVALSFGGHRALVRGAVAKTSTLAEAANTGAATFSVDFTLDETARRQLTDLLTAARAAKVTIKPPPARAQRRYPVEWPVSLATGHGTIRADALDVSSAGLFVRPQHALVVGSRVTFSTVLDDAGGPVAGRARVVRHVADTEAKACGLTAGYGLQVLEMGDTDLGRWYGFLARVEKRSERRVLVGASPGRLAELQQVLTACGYAVTGGTDPGALVRLAGIEARPVDAAIIDGAWLGEGTSAAWFETLFSARDVPCLTLYGDARRVRASIDKVLGI